MVNNTNSCKFSLDTKTGQRILRANCDKCIYSPDLETNPLCMARTINKLMEVGQVNEVVFSQKEDYIYDYTQTQMLLQIANLLNDLVHRRNILSYSALGDGKGCERCYPARSDLLRILVLYELREDPIGAYLHVIEQIKKEETKAKIILFQQCPGCYQTFINTLIYIRDSLATTSLIKAATPFLKNYDPKTREVYKEILRPVVKPNFLYVKLVTSYPAGAEELSAYNLKEKTSVVILKTKDEIRPLYHLTPPEFKLSEDKYRLIGTAKEIIAQHKPRQSEFVDPERTRDIFLSVAKDMLEDMSRANKLSINYDELGELAEVLVRHTIGFGVIEVLLSDDKIQDITVNSPAGINPITIVHSEFGECVTNITITPREMESWATKLRMLSGRPLDEANPVLDTQLIVPGGNARVAAVQPPLSPSGLAYAFRRHRSKPWTTPLFIENKMISALGAGLLSFIIDGARTLLVAGTRSAGKTSLLGSLMIEIMRSNRILTVEDTLELPVQQLKQLKYDIQSFKVQSVITGSKTEISAAEGIRTSLRMGDSCLIVGEVRGPETIALYEAMRVGALANVVAGTIHGASPYGVFDRVVNDLGVPKTSFKATDIIVICNPVKSASGLEKVRRVTQITEIRKEWTDDPLAEHAFVDLMKYNPTTDILEPTAELIEGESEIIKAIAGRVKEWAGDWDAVWENILLRTKIKQELLNAAIKSKNKNILEAKFVIAANDEFHKISELVKKEFGSSDPKQILANWLDWLKKNIKKA